MGTPSQLLAALSLYGIIAVAFGLGPIVLKSGDVEIRTIAGDSDEPGNDLVAALARAVAEVHGNEQLRSAYHPVPSSIKHDSVKRRYEVHLKALLGPIVLKSGNMEIHTIDGDSDERGYDLDAALERAVAEMHGNKERLGDYRLVPSSIRHYSGVDVKPRYEVHLKRHDEASIVIFHPEGSRYGWPVAVITGAHIGRTAAEEWLKASAAYSSKNYRVDTYETWGEGRAERDDDDRNLEAFIDSNAVDRGFVILKGGAPQKEGESEFKHTIRSINIMTANDALRAAVDEMKSNKRLDNYRLVANSSHCTKEEDPRIYEVQLKGPNDGSVCIYTNDNEDYELVTVLIDSKIKTKEDAKTEAKKWLKQFCKRTIKWLISQPPSSKTPDDGRSFQFNVYFNDDV